MEKVKNIFTRMFETVKNAFMNFPISVILIGAITVLFLCDDMVDKYQFLQDIGMFLQITIAGTIFVESFLEKGITDKKKVIGIVICVLIGIIGSFIIDFKSPMKGFYEKWLFEYEFLCAVGAIYILAEKSNKKLENYFLNIFLNIKRNTITYIIVVLGICTLYAIFCILIYDIESEILGKIVIIFTGFYYAPVILNSFLGEDAEDTKFNKMIFTKVFMILLVIAMSIVYLYIVKSLFITGIPKNEVFMILSFIFVFLFPTCIINRNYASESNFLTKVNKYVPILYVPFIFLQIYTMGIRISTYGITEERYFAIILIIFEIISLGLYIYKDCKHLKYFIISTAILSVIAVVSPLNYERASIISQTNIVKKYANSGKSFERLDKEDKKKYSGAYKYLKITNDYELNIKLSSSEIDKLKSYSGYHDYPSISFGKESGTVSYDKRIDGFDISKYSKIYTASMTYNPDIIGHEVELYIDEDYKIDRSDTIIVDLKPLLDKFAEAYEKNGASTVEIFEENNVIKIDDKKDLYITSLKFYQYNNFESIENIDLEGFFLEK